MACLLVIQNDIQAVCGTYIIFLRNKCDLIFKIASLFFILHMLLNFIYLSLKDFLSRRFSFDKIFFVKIFFRKDFLSRIFSFEKILFRGDFISRKFSFNKIFFWFLSSSFEVFREDFFQEYIACIQRLECSFRKYLTQNYNPKKIRFRYKRVLVVLDHFKFRSFQHIVSSQWL